METGDLRAGTFEQRVQVTAAGAIPELHRDFQFRLADDREVHQLLNAFEVGRFGVKRLAREGADDRGFNRPVRFLQARDVRLDLLGDLRMAGAPLLVENFSPWYSAGLWLAVMLMPPMALRLRIVWLMTGVGVSRSQSRGVSPLLAKTSAAASENSRPRNRVSYPMMTTGLRPWMAEPGRFSSACKYSAMPWVATRTLSKVKSRAMSPRQPEVPNLIIIDSLNVCPNAISREALLRGYWRQSKARFFNA